MNKLKNIYNEIIIDNVSVKNYSIYLLFKY